jgi:hypothetical protein
MGITNPCLLAFGLHLPAAGRNPKELVRHYFTACIQQTLWYLKVDGCEITIIMVIIKAKVKVSFFMMFCFCRHCES